MIKKSDIALIILVAAISLVSSYFIGGALINSPESRSTKVEVAVPFDSEILEPSKKIFNANSLNPTEKIKIGEANKAKPFDNSN